MMNKNSFFHASVLVDEVIEALALKDHGVYVDATFGSGGHTRKILESNATVRVVSIDWDKSSLDTYAPLLKEVFGDRFIPIWGNFAHLYKLLNRYDIGLVDGILADFGTSQMQIKEQAGFSVYRDTPLDMRMSTAHYQVTAADVINKAPESELFRIFKEYGEERFARKIARAIVHDRAQQRFETTRQLAGLIERIMPYKKDAIHPATRVFQALRIFINKELDHIRSFLNGAVTHLSKEGRLVCISFHSLEDRLVKQFFTDQEQVGRLQVISKKAIVPTEQEIKDNPSSRSAKLRVAQKIG